MTPLSDFVAAWIEARGKALATNAGERCAMNVIESAWSALLQGVGELAVSFKELDDIIDVEMNGDLQRLEDLTELRVSTADGRYPLLGCTITLRRRTTGEQFCMAIGFTNAPLEPSADQLCRWQFGFWCDAAVDTPAFVSSVYALRGEAGSYVVLEELRPVADPSLQQFILGCVVSSQAFISYVREDSGPIDRLSADLQRRGVATWKDRDDLEPGLRWKDEIKKAIQSGSAFVACFSPRYEARDRTYMNEELTIAVEELRLRPRDRAWFFPVTLDGASVPAITIGAGETLRDLQSVPLDGDWDGEVSRLARAIRAI